MLTLFRRVRRVSVAVIAAIVVVFLSQAVLAQPASAHGKELDISISPLIPDPDQPLLRLYRVRVAYANDLEPVEGATVELAARREDGASTLTPARLTEVEGGAGLYVGEVTFARFGVWDMELSVAAAAAQGEGNVTFEEDVRPGALNPDEEVALRREAERVINLQLSFGFGWWPDVANITMRIVHSFAGLSYFIATSLVFGLAWFGMDLRERGLVRHLDSLFLPAAAASLVVLLGAGLYSAAYDAPITYPGIYDISAMRRIPYGEAYLVTFFVKVVLFFALALLAVRISRTLKRWNWDEPSANGAAAIALRRETLLNVIVGLVVVADVAILVYLHYVSHLGVFLPEV